MLDFDALARDLLAQADTFVPNLFPNGKRRGNEWCVGSLAGEPGESLKINLKTGVWKDFADNGVGGADLISLYAAKHGLTQKQAAEELGANRIREYVPPPVRLLPPAPTEPVFDRPPPGCKRPRMHHQSFGLPVQYWVYKDDVGPFQIKARYEPAGGRKQIVPWTWHEGDRRWRAKGIAKPRPLYGLEHLAARATHPVLITEGEKACEAARELAPRYVCVTWDGGVQSVAQAHWKALQGRDVLIWPDADVAGVNAVAGIFEALRGIASRIRWIDPDGLPESHDAADLVKEGWNKLRFLEWAKPRLKDNPPLLLDVPRETVVPTAPEVAPEIAPVGEVTALEGDERCDSSTDAVQQFHEYEEVNPGDPAVSYPELEAETAPEKKIVTRGKPRDDAEQSTVVAIDEKPAIAPSRYALWTQYGLDCKRNGEPYNNLDNAVRVLELDPVWRGAIWADTFHRKMMRLCDNELGRRPWEDEDTYNLHLYLQREIGLSEISQTTVLQAAKTVASRDKRNELTSWLDSLVWDGQERLRYLLCDGFGTLQNDYTMAVSRCWLVSLVARAYHPGCKVDTVPILEGAQGAFKGTALEVLGYPWYAECHEKVTDKDFYQVIQGVWIVEISEMHSFSKQDIRKIKGVISCRSDRFRASYAHFVSDNPRQGVLSGTTNTDTWNEDETGARRFWPITCNDVDIEWIRTNRDQLFAEAVALYKLVPLEATALQRLTAGAAWWDVPKDLATQEQEARRMPDSWHEKIDTHIHFENWAPTDENPSMTRRLARLEGFTTADLMDFPLKIETSKQGRAEQMRVAAILHDMGMVKKRTQRLYRFYWPEKPRNFGTPENPTQKG